MNWFSWSSENKDCSEVKNNPNIRKNNKRILINKSKQESIWIRTYGENYRVNCYVCERNTITPFSSVIAHKQSISSGGGNNLDNLIHICSHCNSGMYKNNLDDYKKEINL